MHFSPAFASAQLTLFEGTAYLTPILGAWLADAAWGRFKTILVFSIIYMVVRARAGAAPPAAPCALFLTLSVPSFSRCCPPAPYAPHPCGDRSHPRVLHHLHGVARARRGRLPDPQCASPAAVNHAERLLVHQSHHPVRHRLGESAARVPVMILAMHALNFLESLHKYPSCGCACEHARLACGGLTQGHACCRA